MSYCDQRGLLQSRRLDSQTAAHCSPSRNTEIQWLGLSFCNQKTKRIFIKKAHIANGIKVYSFTDISTKKRSYLDFNGPDHVVARIKYLLLN